MCNLLISRLCVLTFKILVFNTDNQDLRIFIGCWRRYFIHDFLRIYHYRITMYCALDKTLSYISNKSGSYCTFVVVARREKRKNTWCKRQRCVSTKQCLSVGRYMRYLAKKCPFQCANDCHMPSRRFYMITKRHIIVGRISNSAFIL